MVIDDLYVWATVASFITFIGILIWALRSARNRNFEEASRLPFQDSEQPAADKPAQEKEHE
ncbi:MAG TPA: cbb3-type cytochrome c oxidase subunit 3 [Methylophilaceae bacterium]|nr:cbb3-type cytochrome c oxidase subunit 3 [Methylophilaceae bacterium]